MLFFILLFIYLKNSFWFITSFSNFNFLSDNTYILILCTYLILPQVLCMYFSAPPILYLLPILATLYLLVYIPVCLLFLLYYLFLLYICSTPSLHTVHNKSPRHGNNDVTFHIYCNSPSTREPRGLREISYVCQQGTPSSLYNVGGVNHQYSIICLKELKSWYMILLPYLLFLLLVLLVLLFLCIRALQTWVKGTLIR